MNDNVSQSLGPPLWFKYIKIAVRWIGMEVCTHICAAQRTNLDDVWDPLFGFHNHPQIKFLLVK